MKYKTHPVIGYISLGVAIGCMIGCLSVTGLAMLTSNPDTLFALSQWVFGLFIAGMLAGIVATHTWPTYLERKHPARHAKRLSDAMRWLHGPRTPTRH